MFFGGDITLFFVMVFDDALDFGNLIGCRSYGHLMMLTVDVRFADNAY